MTRRFTLALFAVLALTMSTTELVRAHKGHVHTLMGTVTMAAADHVMFKDKAGKDVIVHLTKATKVVRDKKALDVSDIKAGIRVVVSAEEGDDKKMMAKTVELGPAPSIK